jgi:integrase
MNLRLPKGLYKRGNIIWMRYYNPWKGESVSCSTGLILDRENIAQARKLREQAKKNIKERKLIPVSEFITPSQLFEKLLENKELSEKTIYVYDTAISHLNEAVLQKALPVYSHNDFEVLKKYWVTNKYSQNSQSMYSRALDTLFRYGIKCGVLRVNPVIKVPPVKKKPKGIPKEDLDKILELLRNRNESGYRLIKFLYLSGLRIGESLNLDWADINFETKLCRVNNTKVHREDDCIPLHQALLDFLNSFPQPHEGKVFPYSSPSSTRFFDRVQHSLFGEKRYCLHQLRKSFISTLINQGLQPTEVKSLARHKSVNTTYDYYADIDLNRIGQTVSQMVKF